MLFLIQKASAKDNKMQTNQTSMNYTGILPVQAREAYIKTWNSQDLTEVTNDFPNQTERPVWIKDAIIPQSVHVCWYLTTETNIIAL